MDQTSAGKSYAPVAIGIVALVLVGGGFLYTQNAKSEVYTAPLTTETTNTETPADGTAMVSPMDREPTSGALEGRVEAPAPTVSIPVVSKPEVVVPTPTPTPKVPVESTKPTLQYKDGTYSVDGTYRSPEGPETIGITLTIKDDFIVDAVAILQARDKQSVKYQEVFVKNFKALVVGKKLSEVSLSKVSGSSLTPKGFNQAVVVIRAKAKA